MIGHGLRLALLALLPLAGGGCAVALGAAAGAVAGSEIAERDGRFDPLENTEIGRAIYE